MRAVALRSARLAARLRCYSSSSKTAAEKSAAALDSYSKVVTSVVEEVGPATIAVEMLGQGGQQGGAGSGFFISPDGYFLTNDHVAAAISQQGGTVCPPLSSRVRARRENEGQC